MLKFIIGAGHGELAPTAYPFRFRHPRSLVPEGSLFLGLLTPMIRRPFHFGRLLAVTYFVLSLLWVLIAFDNPWHQGLLMIVAFPASYLVFGVDAVLAHVFPGHSLLQNVVTDACFVLFGTVWFFVLGTVLQKGAISIFRMISQRKH